jgi:hypothetical protein
MDERKKKTPAAPKLKSMPDPASTKNFSCKDDTSLLGITSFTPTMEVKD